jgi:predicted nucleic acid-binding Zn ribbon protein
MKITTPPLKPRGEGLLPILEHSAGSCVVHELLAEKVHGRCESCGITLGNGIKAMRIPGLPGLYHSILCAEQGIYERGCRFCGEKLASNSHFCSDRCASKAQACCFGDGTRLIALLAKHQPELVNTLRPAENPAVEERRCAYCQGSLSNKRRHARYCSDRCQKAHERQRASAGTREPRRREETPTAVLISQGLTDTQSAQTVPLVR